MTAPTKPGQRCKVVGSRTNFNNEGQSPNMGKFVVTVFLHDTKAGIEQENVWRCKAESGTLTTYWGANGTFADFLECWLEVDELKNLGVVEKIAELVLPPPTGL